MSTRIDTATEPDPDPDLATTMAMPDLTLLLLAAGVGAVLAFLVTRWRSHKAIAALHERLRMSEYGRLAMQERSDQARAQIGQLTKALADAQKQVRESLAAAVSSAHAASHALDHEEADDSAAQTIATTSAEFHPLPDDDHPLLLPRDDDGKTPQAFADTQVL